MAKVKREGEAAAGGAAKRTATAPEKKGTATAPEEKSQAKFSEINMPTMADFPESPQHTVITEVDMSAAPKSRQYCELTLNLMDGKDELICFLMMLEEKVGRVHLTFDRDENNYDKQFKDHVNEVFAANDLPPFDFKACEAWPKVWRQLCGLLLHINEQLDTHPFSESLKMPTPRASTPEAKEPKPWPYFHDCAVKWNMHWAIVICSKE